MADQPKLPADTARVFRLAHNLYARRAGVGAWEAGVVAVCFAALGRADSARIEALLGLASRGGERAGTVVHLANEPVLPRLWHTDDLAT